LAQIADLGGASLITWMVLSAASVPQMLIDFRGSSEPQRRKNAKVGLAFALCVPLLSFGYGTYRIGEVGKLVAQGRPLRVGVIQHDPSFNDSLIKMRESTDRIIHSCDILCWPESTLGVHSIFLKSFANADRTAQFSLPPMIDASPLLGLKLPLIVGGKSFEGPPEEGKPLYQTAFLVNQDGGISGHYHKRRLMPLGEYVPGEDQVPWLHDCFQLSFVAKAGQSSKPMVLPDKSLIGVLICYEDTIASVARETVFNGAQILVCIINASAFEQPIALVQHLRLARLRTIENRRFLVRGSGTGISCVIDPIGRILDQLDPDQPGTMVANTSLMTQTTLFTQVGNWTPYATFVLMSLAILGNRRSTERQKRAKS